MFALLRAGLPSGISPRRGLKVIEITGEQEQEATEVARAIAELGQKKWEMVGCANTSQFHFTVFFKRPM